MLWLSKIRLKSPSSAQREGAAKELGRSGDFRAVEPLTQALSDSSASVTTAAIEALRQIGGAEVIAVFVTRLGTDSSFNSALSKMGDAGFVALRAVRSLDAAGVELDRGSENLAIGGFPRKIARSKRQIGSRNGHDPQIAPTEFSLRSLRAEAQPGWHAELARENGAEAIAWRVLFSVRARGRWTSERAIVRET